MTIFFDNVYTVKDLLDVLNQVEDKNLSVRLEPSDMNSEENLWLTAVTLHETGNSGYEEQGEVVLHDD